MNIHLKFGVFVVNELKAYDKANFNTCMVHYNCFVKHNNICDLVGRNSFWDLFIFRYFPDALTYNVVPYLT